MALNKTDKFILYALMQVLGKVNKKFDKMLKTSVSKIMLIKLLKQSTITSKSERGLYKNLESLEKKKYIKYENKLLMITKKGLRTALKLEKEIIPYVKLTRNIDKVKTKNLQTRFK